MERGWGWGSFSELQNFVSCVIRRFSLMVLRVRSVGKSQELRVGVSQKSVLVMFRLGNE